MRGSEFIFLFLFLVLSFEFDFGKLTLMIHSYRQIASSKPTGSEGLKCAIDHILEAEQKGEINEDNVLYIVENINVAGNFYFLLVGYVINPLDVSACIRNWTLVF